MWKKIFAGAFLCFLLSPGLTRSAPSCPGADPSNIYNGTRFICEKPTSCENRTFVAPAEDPTKFYACVQNNPKIYELECLPTQCFDAETKKCVWAVDWRDKCDREPATTTTTTTTTTAAPSPLYTGMICPNANATNVRPGTDTCEKPRCYFGSLWKYPLRDPQLYCRCLFFYIRVHRCPDDTCFDKDSQSCVVAAKWRNSCV